MNTNDFSNDVWMFPGQGSQAPGIFDHLEHSYVLLRKIEGLLGPVARSLKQLGHTTWSTDLVQPAVCAASLAAAHAISTIELPGAVLGHSLGEITALVVSRSISPDDGLKMVTERGKAMEVAAREAPGGMAAVMALSLESIEEICQQVGGVWVANYNAPDQTVISGLEGSLAKAAERCLQAGARAVKKLAVPVAAHTPLMDKAATRFSSLIGDMEILPPQCSFFSVVDGKPHDEPAEIKDLLVRAITSPVMFHLTVASVIATGKTNFVEVGPGNALGRIVQRGFPEATVASVATDEAAESYRGSSKAYESTTSRVKEAAAWS